MNINFDVPLFEEKHGCMDNMLSLCFDLCYLLFLAFDFCRFCVVIVCFHPRHNGQLPPTAKDSNLTIQGNYWYHCYILFGMTRSMTGD